jgi:ribonuclease P protein component
MIGRKNRFTGRRDPRIVLKHGKSIRSTNLQLKYLKNKESVDYRAAIIVNKKISKSAPTRNRIRRRLYEILRKLDIPKGTDLIILAYDNKLADSKHSQLVDEVKQLISKINSS